MTARLGTRHDAAIRAMILQGMSCPIVSDRLPVSLSFVRDRVAALGLRQAALANGMRARRAAPKRNSSAAGQAVTLTGRVDHDPSRIVRSLRSTAAPTFHDPIGALACLHRRGLTLPDFEVCFGISPVEAVAAIRRSA